MTDEWISFDHTTLFDVRYDFRTSKISVNIIIIITIPKRTWSLVEERV